jgi:hypothetical protein
MKTLKLLSLVVLLSGNVLFSQKLHWNPTMENICCNDLSKYAGEANGKQYFVLNSTYKPMTQILEFSENFSAQATKIQAFGEEAFISANKLNIIRSTFKTEKKITTNQIIVKSFDLKGTFIDETILFSEEEKKEKGSSAEPAVKITFFLSDNKKYLAIQKQNQVTVFDSGNLKSLKTYQTESFKPTKNGSLFKTNLEYFLLNNGDLITIEKTNTPTLVSKHFLNSSDIKNLNVPLKNDYESFDPYFKISEDQQTLYLATLFGGSGIVSQTGTLVFNQQVTKGILINKVEIRNLAITDTKSVMINESVIKETGKKNGVPFLKIINILENAGDYYIITEKENSNTNSENKVTTYYEDLVLIKINPKSESVQKIIKKDQYRNPGVFSTFSNEHLYLVYNEGAEPKTDIKVTKMDRNLEIKNSITEPTYKEHKIYLNVKHTHKISENKYFIFGRMQDNVGSVILELN